MATANTTTRVTGRLAAQFATRQRSVCLRCQYRAIISCEGFAPSSSSFNPTRGLTSESFAQRLRRRLRGTTPSKQPEEPAPKPEVGADEDDGYVAAKTWDGLQRIGGKQEREAWQKIQDWEGFKLPTKLQSKDDIFDAVHRALVEVFTLKEAGRPSIVLTQLGDDRVLEASPFPSLSQDQDGRVKVQYLDEASKEAVINILSPPPPTPPPPPKRPRVSKTAKKGWRRHWVRFYTEEWEWVNQPKAQEDDVLEPEKLSPEDIRKSGSVIEFETILEDKLTDEVDRLNEAVAHIHEVVEPEKSSYDDNRRSDSVVQLESTPEEKTRKEVDWMNQAEDQGDDVFEPEEPSPDVIQSSESAVQPRSILEDEIQKRESAVQPAPPLEDKTATQNHDVRDVQSDIVLADNWINIRFPDPAVKFAILRRVMQLTGHHIPDPALQDINSSKALIGHLIKKPKPKKVAERLTGNEALMNLPNMKVRERRWSLIDKDKEVGRWKVIEEKLREKGLPIASHPREGSTAVADQWRPYHVALEDGQEARFTTATGSSRLAS